MFREVRRKNREMNREDIIKVLNEGLDGILGTISVDNDYPYTVPVNYIYFDNKIYFHSALEGHKIDNIKKNPKVSFTIINRNEILASKFSTNYQSVTLFGHAKLVEPSKEILLEIIKKYSGDFLESGKKYINNDYMKTQIVEITIDHISGKERKQ